MFNMKKCTIPIFFSSDDNYIPFLAVAITSLVNNASKEYKYDITVLNTGVSYENKERIKKLQEENVNIKFVDVKHKIEKIANKLESRLRDYYSLSIYYRLFIPSMFPQYKKALYLDADITIIDDISKLYNEDIEGYLVGAITDDVIPTDERLQIYTREALDLEPEKYFNSGVLLMNLYEFKKQKIEEKFIYLLEKYNFDVVAPDQDYLNVLCKGKVKYIDKGWDRMPNPDENFDDNDLHLIHYNMFAKPWKYDDVLYQEHFWEYAAKTDFYDNICNIKNSQPVDMILRDNEGAMKLMENSYIIAKSDYNFKTIFKRDNIDFN